MNHNTLLYLTFEGIKASEDKYISQGQEDSEGVGNLNQSPLL